MVSVCWAFQKGPAAFVSAQELPSSLDRQSSLSRTVLGCKSGGKYRKKRVAVLFSGGPAAGGHNVLVGLGKIIGENLLGVHGGPQGLLEGNIFPLKTDGLLNTGGFDALGTSRTKIRTAEQMQRVREVCKIHHIEGIVIIGGDDSNTNAVFLAEHLAQDNITVVSVPKTMDGDLQVKGLLPIPFGFDTATKVYGELVGNLCKDTASSLKYWHFVRLMGRETSHVTLELALKTHPALAFISEEIAQHHQSLQFIVDEILKVMRSRALIGKDYGTILIPEGLFEAIPEFQTLLFELEQHISASLSRKSSRRRAAYIGRRLSKQSAELFDWLPESIQAQLTKGRDAHGNLKVSQIPTEQLLAMVVSEKLPKADIITHFYGYEGRCSLPSSFDAALAYNLGLLAGSLVLAGHTGFMASLTNLDSGGKPLGIPLASLLANEQRNGEQQCVIRKTYVDLESPAYKEFAAKRSLWATQDGLSCGPLQLDDKSLPLIVSLNNKYGGTFKIR